MTPKLPSGFTRRSLTVAFSVALVSFAYPALAAAQGRDFIVSAGETRVYNASIQGPITVNRFAIEAGGEFVAIGPAPLKIAAASVDIDGGFFASGMNSAGVLTINDTDQAEVGALGSLGGGQGGTGSVNTLASTPVGLKGGESYGMSLPGIPLGGGGGGETGFAAPVPGSSTKDIRRGAGGGGGALAANSPISSDPFATEDIGLLAQAGMDGGPNGTGAISGNARAAGGLPGLPFFQDSDPSNDFWGTKASVAGPIIGEAGRPLPGRGGGAGGDAVSSATFPLNPFSADGDEKGAGGGGGGGLVLIITRSFRLGSTGRLAANGGSGGGGENALFFDRVGGGSGGGSGGWIIVDSLEMDLSMASDNSITALGGQGGPGRENRFPGGPFGTDFPGAGGNGGPGVIQLHVPSGLEAEVLVPAGKSTSDLSAPDAHILLPQLGN